MSLRPLSPLSFFFLSFFFFFFLFRSLFFCENDVDVFAYKRTPGYAPGLVQYDKG